jgi:hypothetical protein
LVALIPALIEKAAGAPYADSDRVDLLAVVDTVLPGVAA